MAVTYPHFDEQHMWRSGSSSPRNLSALVVHRRARPKPFSRQASRRLHSLLELRYAALAATWQSSTPTSHTRKKGSESGIGSGGEHLQGCRTSSQGPCPKTQKRDDLAPRTRSASILRPPCGNLIWRRRSERTLASRTLTSFLRQCSW
jgi:hypothetical protein